MTAEIVATRIDEFSRVEFRALLLAPDKTAKATLLVASAARDVAATLRDSRKRGDAVANLREAKQFFVHSARADLGIAGDLLSVTRRRATNMTPAAGNGAAQSAAQDVVP